MNFPFDRVSEVERLLESDDSLLGRFWKYEKEGLTPQQMADREETATVGWVHNYRRLTRILCGKEELPTAPSVAIGVARKIRTWLREVNLSNELRSQLEAEEQLLSSRAEDRRAQTEEVVAAVKATETAEAVGTAGIYVYTLPHYLRHPVDSTTNKTLLKVGHSSKDAFFRAGSAGRLTALPEDPILLRIYPATDSAAMEKQFHAALRAADHANGSGKRVGSEWFITSTKFLDFIARTLGLDVQEIDALETTE